MKTKIYMKLYHCIKPLGLWKFLTGLPLMLFLLNPSIMQAQAPVASFTFTPTQPLMGFDNVNFTNTSTGSGNSYLWIITPMTYEHWTSFAGPPTMEDAFFFYNSGHSSTNIELFFEKGGPFEVCLIATNSSGSDTTCTVVNVKANIEMCGMVLDDSPTGFLHDDTGPFIPYNIGNTCYFLISPCASQVTFQLQTFNIRTSDFLRIYDGRDNTGTPLWDITNYPNGMTGNLSHGSVKTNFTANTGFMYFEFEKASSGSPGPIGFTGEWNSTPLTGTPPPVAGYNKPDTVCIDNPVTFENISTGFYPRFRWYIDNVLITSTSIDFTHTFANSGTYEVKLVAENCIGKDSVVHNINVFVPTQAPPPAFEADLLFPALGEVVKFTDLTSYCVASWEWIITPSTYTFVNGTNKFSRHPQVTFSAEGCYTVTLVAGNTFGTDNLVKTCYITAIGYCAIPNIGVNSDVGISRVKLEQIDNNTPIGQTGYSDYTLSHEASLSAAGTYQITLERNSTSTLMSRGVWIDFNQNGSFEASERVAFENAARTLTWTATFQVPANAVAGATRMRVGAVMGATQVSPCPTTTSINGEYEDYRIWIIPDSTAPVISLIGPDTMYIEKCFPFNDPGATATDVPEGDITSRIVVNSSNVDTMTEGIYKVYYNVSDLAGNQAQEVVRVVIVTPDVTPTVITLFGNNPDLLLVNHSYNEPGYSAIDKCDGDITANVSTSHDIDSSFLGTYTKTYNVTDASGNPRTVIRTVIVADTVAPVINFVLGDSIYHEVKKPLPSKATWENATHVTVTDNYYTGVRARITSGYESVNPNLVGDYILTYCATDLSGNTSCKIRTVYVRDSTPPVITILGNNPDTVLRWHAYTGPNPPASSVDAYDGPLPTPTVGPGTTLDVMLMGEYVVEYVSTDSSGNTARAYRTVVVIDNVSAGKNELERYLKVYPNPGKGLYNVDVQLPESRHAEIRVVNMLGEEVARVFEGNLINRIISFDISHLSAGMYFVRVNTEGQSAVVKILKE